jgi:hypothetical protein
VNTLSIFGKKLLKEQVSFYFSTSRLSDCSNFFDKVVHELFAVFQIVLSLLIPCWYYVPIRLIPLNVFFL